MLIDDHGSGPLTPVAFASGRSTCDRNKPTSKATTAFPKKSNRVEGETRVCTEYMA